MENISPLIQKGSGFLSNGLVPISICYLEEFNRHPFILIWSKNPVSTNTLAHKSLVKYNKTGLPLTFSIRLFNLLEKNYLHQFGKILILLILRIPLALMR